MADDETILMVGLPESGKTTFLAALWSAVNQPDPAADALTLVSLPLERKYLDSIAEVWLACKRLDRTRVGDEPPEVTLALRTGDTTFELVVPDVAGEGFQQVWEEQNWPERLETLASRASRVMLFVRVDQVRYLAPLEGSSEGDTNSAAERPWNPRETPTQVKLVELLQQTFKRRPPGAIRLAVLMSAWDVVAEDGIAPVEWFAINLPLAHQFLRALDPEVATEMFGVSSQGGDILDPKTKDRLLEIENPGDRVVVVGDEVEDKDITRPLRWLLNA